MQFTTDNLLEIKRLYHIDNFGEPDIIQLFENGEKIKEFAAKSFNKIDILENEKNLTMFLINRENNRARGE